MKYLSKVLVLLAAVSVAQLATASSEQEEQLKRIEIYYQAVCHYQYPTGTTAKEIKEVQEAGASLRGILKNPKTALQRILEEGQRKDLGVFSVIVSCSMVEALKDLVAAQGCTDTDGTKLGAPNVTEAVATCQNLIKTLQNR